MRFGELKCVTFRSNDATKMIGIQYVPFSLIIVKNHINYYIHCGWKGGGDFNFNQQNCSLHKP